MRWIPALLVTLLVATPLIAQEPSEQQREAESIQATRKRAEEIRRIEEMRAKIRVIEADLRKAADELAQKTEATREEALDAVKRARDAIEKLLPLCVVTEKTQVDGTYRITLPVGVRTLRVDTEVISGSADGTDYTLKSLGDGKYELTATKRDESGKLMEETKDQGTLKDLQEKYAFLRSGLAIGVPQLSDVPFTVRGRVTQGLGVIPFWGGGGQVGVTVAAPSEDLRFHLELPEGAGFIVQEVAPGSRAEQIGIRRMDVLLRLDGELIDSPVQLKKLHEKAGVLELIRRSETRKIELGAVAADADGR